MRSGDKQDRNPTSAAAEGLPQVQAEAGEYAYTAIHYIPQIAEVVAAHGIDVAAWLARAGFDLDKMAQPGYQIPTSSYLKLLKDAVSITGDSALGIRVGCALPPSAHGIMGLATMAAGSILEAMEIIHTYVPLRTALLAIRPEVVGKTLRVVFEPLAGLEEVGHTVAEIAIGAVKNIADTKLPIGSACTGASFVMASPPYASLAQSLLACPVEYGQTWNGLSFGLHDAQRSTTFMDVLVMSEALAVCQRELDRVTSNRSVAARLERLLLESKGGAFPRLEVCARELKLSPRTLHRRLLDEGTTYKVVLDNVRRRLAGEYLKTQHLGIKETSFLLGYEDIANFRRAFKRWYGVSPSKS
ncbi:putative HTH-type transcriptional regulator [Pseudomonas extremaustralis]|uniref:Putative HTH-type transcriptional regulator n=1 Tax=Pseudomonas extremaustralis TaxID=359110 RepID=A0A5M9J3Z0_9PSED|nr:AraC family transcriptional regulator [Pseudomonas extremaustralis]KAA8562812.1 putative HTH-type transcriptional regulator [Pseudomonas extremaustralis]